MTQVQDITLKMFELSGLQITNIINLQISQLVIDFI